MGDTPNPHRGEVEIQLGGKTYVMRPTFEAIVEAETRTGLGLVTMASKAAVADLSLSHFTWIIVSGLKASGEDATYKTVGPMVFEAGIESVHQPVVDYLTNALNGGKPMGEAKAPGEGKTGTTTGA